MGSLPLAGRWWLVDDRQSLSLIAVTGLRGYEVAGSFCAEAAPSRPVTSQPRNPLQPTRFSLRQAAQMPVMFTLTAWGLNPFTGRLGISAS